MRRYPAAVVYRWALGVVLLLVGGVPVLLALWGLGLRADGDAAGGYLAVAGIGLPALLLGGYLVSTALRDEGRASRR
jgi:hypothetical protein